MFKPGRMLDRRGFAARAGDHTVRVFVSSTFRDMQGERDALAANCFPLLREAVERLGRGIQEVDLRWGVTREEAESGEVLRVCLDGIDAGRPQFRLMLGGRYGWVDPDAKRACNVKRAFLAAMACVEKCFAERLAETGYLEDPMRRGGCAFGHAIDVAVRAARLHAQMLPTAPTLGDNAFMGGRGR